jgi:putative hydrolase of HD superfamily
LDRTRHENDAEHSWHLAMMALILLEYANDKTIDLLRVLKMVLIHDLVEIDAGDTSAYDDKGQEEKYDRELAAANRLFGMLPEDQRNELFELWQEFEERKTSESLFAAALDRLSPLLLNYHPVERFNKSSFICCRISTAKRPNSGPGLCLRAQTKKSSPSKL